MRNWPTLVKPPLVGIIMGIPISRPLKGGGLDNQGSTSGLSLSYLDLHNTRRLGIKAITMDIWEAWASRKALHLQVGPIKKIMMYGRRL